MTSKLRLNFPGNQSDQLSEAQFIDDDNVIILFPYLQISPNGRGSESLPRNRLISAFLFSGNLLSFHSRISSQKLAAPPLSEDDIELECSIQY